jgi:hypothetical protein
MGCLRRGPHAGGLYESLLTTACWRTPAACLADAAERTGTERAPARRHMPTYAAVGCCTVDGLARELTLGAELRAELDTAAGTSGMPVTDRSRSRGSWTIRWPLTRSRPRLSPRFKHPYRRTMRLHARASAVETRRLELPTPALQRSAGVSGMPGRMRLRPEPTRHANHESPLLPLNFRTFWHADGTLVPQGV